MIKFDKVFFTSDWHGKVPDEFKPYFRSLGEEKVAVIIGGDLGANFFLNKRDDEFKTKLCNYAPNLFFYCLRGNHDVRPEDVPGMELIWDDYTDAFVYYEKEYPNIIYFKDGVKYNFNGTTILAIGGGYSVDKWFRLQNHWTWIENEQLTSYEMYNIHEAWKGIGVDIVLTHVAPYKLQPFDLFMPEIDQSMVDKSMETWLDVMSEDVKYRYWLFGHYHQCRRMRPNITMLNMTHLIALEDILNDNYPDSIIKDRFFDIDNYPNF